MNPLQTLIRQIIAIALAAAFGLLVRKGILTFEQSEALTPTMQLVVDFYLPLFFPALTAVAHQIYLKYISSRLFEAARNMPAGVTEKQINDTVLGDGGKRTAAQFLAGVK